MIKITQTTSRKAEVDWETGNDFKFLKTLQTIIDERNQDKTKLMGEK